MFKKWWFVILISFILSITISAESDGLTKITVHAQNDIIQFEDKNLESEIKKIIGKSANDEVTISDALSITVLDLTGKNISNLEGIQYFTNIKMLKLGDNKISNLSPLSNLKKMDYLALYNNQIKDLSPLSTLTDLILLSVSDNKIESVDELANLVKLSYLLFTNNDISDISLLDNLEDLNFIEFSNNHIYDISILEGILRFSHGMILDQSIQLSNQSIKKGSSVQIVNPVKDRFGPVSEIKVEGGDYDEGTNTVIWENINKDQTLSYTFEEVVNISQYGDVEFSGTVSVDVRILENKKPTLLGVEDKSIKLGESFNSLDGVSASDEEDGALTNQIEVTGTVDTEKVGQYQITYSVTDSNGETTTAKRVITIIPKNEVSNQTPTIDAANRIITVGESFDPLKGVTAFDSEDKDLTSSIEVIINDVDTTTPGTYDVTYKVVDSEGVETDLTIMVMVREIPQTGYSSFLIQGIILIIGSGLMINSRKGAVSKVTQVNELKKG